MPDDLPLFLNRELSWLEFNQRVLDEAHDPSNPILERVKFLTITGSNLDEFFEVRVAGLKQQVESGTSEPGSDGLTAEETLQAVRRRVLRMIEEQNRCWREELKPQLARQGIRFLGIRELTRKDFEWLESFYRTDVHPVLTPLAIDPAHAFPQLLNKSLNMIVSLEMETGGKSLRHLAVVQVPRALPRLVRMPRGDRHDRPRHEYVFLAHVIGHFLGNLFPGTRILGYWQFRITRNSELYIDEEEVRNLLKAVESELHNRRRGAAVRLEVEKDCPARIRSALVETFNLTEDDLYVIDGPLNLVRLMAIYEGEPAPGLKDPPFVAPIAASLRDRADLFSAIRERDILLHHPYESFESVVDFLEQSSVDPMVLAIKMTLYRTGGDKRIVEALIQAARNGKQVTAVVELRARFDEANNIQWARQLEEAGVNVAYGLVGYKIHAKMCLVVRRESHSLRRYLHLATGNYNASTARFYTDLGYFTARPDFGEDAANLFNLLTGVCQFGGMKKFVVAPFEMHTRVLEWIEREADSARRGLPARIIARMNSLVDHKVIEALYRAAEAGTKIDLVVRGVCCLRPGLPQQGGNITVRSVVDRFLEHSRVWYFENGCKPQVYVASADWMPRNFFRRIEVAFPVEDGLLIDRIVREVLGVTLADNVKARRLQPDGSYDRPGPITGNGPAVRSQSVFMNLASESERQPVRKRSRARWYPEMRTANRPPELGPKTKTPPVPK
jgi:polyphosphate kinase